MRAFFCLQKKPSFLLCAPFSAKFFAELFFKKARRRRHASSSLNQNLKSKTKSPRQKNCRGRIYKNWKSAVPPTLRLPNIFRILRCSSKAARLTCSKPSPCFIRCASSAKNIFGKRSRKYKRLFWHNGVLRLPYWRHARSVRPQKPIRSTVSAAIAPPAALCGKGSWLTLLFHWFEYLL